MVHGLPRTSLMWRFLAPKLAAGLGKGMIGDCVGYRSEEGRLVFVRQMFHAAIILPEPPSA